ncbi:hypothetical protein GTA08_BOTSDO12808 [Botryosphaeria dothidea]|uniref:Uncharacterized protein n=1 Tax=Botryosphaeria dothidea TaxID=55169 RepID=A0A8H4J1H3_9PEZI|nr:hypothetical protein GTA08_BOTSDO12808 [Botryosphaeria dothidea]
MQFTTLLTLLFASLTLATPTYPDEILKRQTRDCNQGEIDWCKGICAEGQCQFSCCTSALCSVCAAQCNGC